VAAPSDYGVAPFKASAQNVYEAVDSPLDPNAERKTVRLVGGAPPLAASASAPALTYDRVDASMLTHPIEYASPSVFSPTMPMPQFAPSFLPSMPGNSSPVIAARGAAALPVPGVVEWKTPDELFVPSARMPQPAADYERKKWFFAKASREDAEKSLVGKPFGAFVVRKASKPGCLAISHVEHGGKVTHAVLHIHRGELNRFGYSIEKSARTYETLEALLADLPMISGADYGMKW